MKSLIFSLLFILLVMPSLFSIANYEARENDSRLYTRFVGQLEKRPIREFIALEWRNYSPYQDPDSPYVRDHLVGQFIPSVVLAKLGWDYRYVHYVVNQVYRFFIPLLLYLFALNFMDAKRAFWVMLCAHINIMALNYGLRANQEQALLFGFLLSLIGFFQYEKPRGKFIFFFGVVFSFLVKGLVGLIHYPFWLMWICGFSKNKKKDFLILTYAGLAILMCGGLYEWWFWSVTGASFWQGYFEIQVFGRSGPGGIPFSSLLYYLPRGIGYSIPWVFGIYFLFKESSGSKEGQFISLGAALSIGFVIVLGSFSRHASRYIFPVYYLICALGALGYSYLPFFEKLKGRFDHMKTHIFLFWGIFLIQYGTFLYKGKTYIN